MKKILILSHSGGLDSSTLFLKALTEGYTVLPINYIYGQANLIEIEAQKLVQEDLKKRFPDQILDSISVDFTSTIGNSISTFQKNRDNNKTKDTLDMKYYMPSRNLLFMSTAAVIGEIIAIDQDIKEISLGLGIHKHSDIYERDYWDISCEFANKLQDLLLLNDNISISVYAPYKDQFKSKIIEDSFQMGLDFTKTWTCYEPTIVEDKEKITYTPCNTCEACKERLTQGQEFGHDEINDYSLIIKK